MSKKYTFYAMSLGEAIYPKREIIDHSIFEDVEINDTWTFKKEEARTWDNKKEVSEIAKNYYNTKVIELDTKEQL